MSADIEQWPPPDDPVAFESLCLELWKEIWGPHSGAAKNGRSGQPQAGVDISGRKDDRWFGVQCKQKSGLLHARLSQSELKAEVEAAKGFQPPLSHFILATTGPADGKVEELARTLTASGPFEVEVWSWGRIWSEIYHREALLARIGPTYWPRLFEFRGAQRIAPSRLPCSAPKLFGRDTELALLEAAWTDPKVHIVTLVAWGGVGKTSLVAQWAADLATRDYDGASYFDWSFHSQGTREQGGASSDTFLAEALRFFGDEEMAASARSAWDKGARLAQLVAKRRTLLILDGLEPLQHPPGPLEGELKDPGVLALLKGLAAQNNGLCLVTSRESLRDLARYNAGTAPEWELERLSMRAGVQLLGALGVLGTSQEIEALVGDVAGHALTLNLLGSYLADAHGGDIRRRDRISLEEADSEKHGGQAFRVMEAYELWLAERGEAGATQLAILSILGLFDRPAEGDCIAALRKAPAVPGLTEALVDLPEKNWNLACSALRKAHLLATAAPSGSYRGPTITDATLDAHPLVREYFAKRLREERPEAWRAAHSRLFDHLRTSTKHWPETLDGLQPLYQAVVHGCKAGRHREAWEDLYRGRILRGTEYDGFYTWRKLGAFGVDLSAASCFFETPWKRASRQLNERDVAWLLSIAAFDLRALGRNSEALEPMRDGLEAATNLFDWRNAARYAGNLSELELALGDIARADEGAARAVELADRSADSHLRVSCRAVRAHVLHQANRLTEALTLFRDAELLQGKLRPKFPLLYSLGGFRYCDALLDAPELTILWKARSSGFPGNSVLATLEEVETRTTQSLKWAERNDAPVLDFAMGRLLLGRIALLRAILNGDSLLPVREQLKTSEEAFIRAGQLQFMPSALITQAWLCFLEDNRDKARVTLDRAHELASRCEMPLELCEVYLCRSRWFRDGQALATAQLLIEKHRYWRRKELLTEIEAAAKD